MGHTTFPVPYYGLSGDLDYFLERLATNPPSSSSLTKRTSTSSFAFSDAALGLLDAISCKTT